MFQKSSFNIKISFGKSSRDNWTLAFIEDDFNIVILSLVSLRKCENVFQIPATPRGKTTFDIPATISLKNRRTIWWKKRDEIDVRRYPYRGSRVFQPKVGRNVRIFSLELKNIRYIVFIKSVCIWIYFDLLWKWIIWGYLLTYHDFGSFFGCLNSPFSKWHQVFNISEIYKWNEKQDPYVDSRHTEFSKNVKFCRDLLQTRRNIIIHKNCDFYKEMYGRRAVCARMS